MTEITHNLSNNNDHSVSDWRHGEGGEGGKGVKGGRGGRGGVGGRGGREDFS